MQRKYIRIFIIYTFIYIFCHESASSNAIHMKYALTKQVYWYIDGGPKFGHQTSDIYF